MGLPTLLGIGSTKLIFIVKYQEKRVFIMNKNELYQSEINLIENIKKYINYRNNVQNILFHQEYIKVTLYIPLVFTILFATFFIVAPNIHPSSGSVHVSALGFIAVVIAFTLPISVVNAAINKKSIMKYGFIPFGLSSLFDRDFIENRDKISDIEDKLYEMEMDLTSEMLMYQDSMQDCPSTELLVLLSDYDAKIYKEVLKSVNNEYGGEVLCWIDDI